MDKQESDILHILEAIEELPQAPTQEVLIDFLIGCASDTVSKKKLDRLSHYCSMAYTKDELTSLLDVMTRQHLIIQNPAPQSADQAIALTQEGMHRLHGTQQRAASAIPQFTIQPTVITERDREIFSAFGDFLGNYDDEQKKAIIDNHSHILCVAGAGSGKTAVLTKRIEFLATYRSVPPERVLAITFTRKARAEMQTRLAKTGFLSAVHVETFNSFCERMLNQYNNLAYTKPVSVLSLAERYRIIGRALSTIHLSIQQAVDRYFSLHQKRSKTPDQLSSIFVHDCFFIRDYAKSKARSISDLLPATKDTTSATWLVRNVCTYIDAYLEGQGLRDYADQLLDTLTLFRAHPEVIPRFDHILIDEFQDVNATQMELVSIMTPQNLFCVGDPRQAIFGWRGSDISYISGFARNYPGSQVLTLTRNYRSTPHIVTLSNHAIAHMKLPPLQATRDGAKDIKLTSYDSEDEEFASIIQRIKSGTVPPHEVFVLARTNRQLNDLSLVMAQQGIKHIVRSDELRRTVIAGPEEITLATIHAIKGMEAELVFVVGCNTANFPCRSSEHPVIEMVKVDEYDKEEEERRLFYVALSRAKRSLQLSYTGRFPTYFLSPEMTTFIEGGTQKKLKEQASSPAFTRTANAALDRLRRWRSDESAKHDIAPYMVFSDKTLHELVQRMPSDPEELLDITGMGPVKIRRYGKQIIKLVNGW